MIVFSNSNTVTELFIVRPYYRETEGAPQNNHRSVSLPGVHIQNETEMFSVGDRSSSSSVGSLFCAHSAATEIAVLPIRRCVVHGRARRPHDDARSAARAGTPATDDSKSESEIYSGVFPRCEARGKSPGRQMSGREMSGHGERPMASADNPRR